MFIYLAMRNGVRKRFNTVSKLFTRSLVIGDCEDQWHLYDASAEDIKELSDKLLALQLPDALPRTGLDILLQQLNVDPMIDRFEISGTCGIVLIKVHNKLRRVEHRLIGDDWGDMKPFAVKKLDTEARRKLIHRMFMLNVTQADIAKYLGMTPSSISRDIKAMSNGK